MNVGMKWLATAVVMVSLWFSCRDAAAADAPTTGGAAAADPAVWGVYSELPGTEWSGYDGNVKWLWGPDGTIVESRTFQMKSVIRPGANRGELVSVYGGGLHTYDGRITSDGSVLWIRRGRFLKMPSRVSIVDGRFIEEMVKLDEASQVAKVNSAHPFEQTGGPRRITATAPASEERASQREVQPIVVQTVSLPVVDPVEVATNAQVVGGALGLGIYEQLVGKAFVLPDGRKGVWRLSPSGSEVIREMFDAAGGLEWIAVVARLNNSGKLGSVEKLRGVEGSTGTKWGQVQPDGSVRWTNDMHYATHESLQDSVLMTAVFDPHGTLLASEKVALIENPQAVPEDATRDAMAIKLLGDLPGFVGIATAGIEARARSAEKQRKMGESARRFNRSMESASGVLAEASNAVGGYAEAQVNLDATVANINAAAALERQQQALASPQDDVPGGTERAKEADNARRVADTDQAQLAEPVTQPQPQPRPSDIETNAAESAAPAARTPLRFVMSISLRNQPGDKVNPTCYSNIVNRPGPPGWGAPGFLPPGSAEQARETVYGLKSAFIAQCRASGREITSEGNFNFQMNQMRGDEERLPEMRARYSEDVSVSL